MIVKIEKVRLVTNILALAIVTLSLLAGYFILRDPFHFRYNNTNLTLHNEEIEALSSMSLGTCSPEKVKLDCYEDELRNITRSYGLENAKHVLLSIQKKDPYITSCHSLAHRMGSEAYKRSPWEFRKLVKVVDTSNCSSGFLHGVLEGYAGNNPNTAIDGAFADEMCSLRDGFSKKNACIHVMGHVFLLHEYGNVKEALPHCGEVERAFKYECYVGLFMENHYRSVLSEHGILPVPEKNEAYSHTLEKLCASYLGIVKKACWKEMADMYISLYRYDVEKVFTACAKGVPKETGNECKLKAVEIFSQYHPFLTGEGKLNEICLLYEKAGGIYRDCTDRILLSQTQTSATLIPYSNTFCNSMSATNRETCFSILVNKIQENITIKDQLQSACEALEDVYKNTCFKI